MKLTIEKSPFIKSWSLAERSVGTSSALNILSGILVRASDSAVELFATDLKTSVVCQARGGSGWRSPGKRCSPSSPWGICSARPRRGSSPSPWRTGRPPFWRDGAGTGSAPTGWRSSHRLPSSAQATPFGSATVGQLSESLAEGTLAASTGEEYPQFLSCAFFQPEKGFLRVVSTDSRRLAYSRFAVGDAAEGPGLLLPAMKGVKELDRILSSLDPETPVKIRQDEAQAYFTAPEMEFAVRRVGGQVPPGTNGSSPAAAPPGSRRAAPPWWRRWSASTVVVRDFNRMVVLQLSPGGSCTLPGAGRRTSARRWRRWRAPSRGSRFASPSTCGSSWTG